VVKLTPGIWPADPLCSFHYYANCAHTTAADAAAKRFSYKFSSRKETQNAPSTFEDGSARFREKFRVESVAGSCVVLA
jgi:hypothetical protein